MRRALSVLLVVVLAAPGCATRLGSGLGLQQNAASDPGAQAPAGSVAGRSSNARPDPRDIPRSYAEQLPAGRQVDVRLKAGDRFKATFMGVEGDAVRLQRTGRIPVPPEVIPLVDIAVLRVAEGGTSTVKAALIGVAAGAAAFLGLLMLSIAAWAD